MQCYVEEQAKLRDTFMLDSYKILKSLLNKLKFIQKILNNSKDTSFSHDKKDNIVQEFLSLDEIEILRKNDKHKYIGRNLLGVRKLDDWINNLEIGNVMHLTPITTSEFMQNLGKHHEF